MAQYKVFMHEFKFVKMNGLGNDFIVIDQRVSEFDLSEEQIKLICNRTDGVGCDQLIMIRKSRDNSDPLIKFFNSDGSEIDACGNGSRCVANFLMKETKRKKINLTTRERTIACEKIDEVTVSVNMGKPKFKWNEIPLTIVKGISFHLNFGLPIFTLTVTSSIFSHAIVLSRVVKFIFFLFVSFIKKFATHREPFPQASISLPSELKNLISGSLLSRDFLIIIS